jgi:PD-(D/E)XK endonuclease
MAQPIAHASLLAMEHPKAKGDRTTLAVMLALQDAGYIVLMPFGENTRYDLVIDDGQAFARIQCKTGRLRGGAVLFSTCSCYGHHMNPGMSRRDYKGQIDYFAVHCFETDWVYLVPIAPCPTKAADHCGWKHRGTISDAMFVGQRISNLAASRWQEPTGRLLQNLAAGLMLLDLALDALEGVVDRLRVDPEALGHVLVGRAFEVQA